MHKPNQIVFTTIFYPEELLWAYFNNLKKYNHLDKTKIWVIGDNKTPPALGNVCQQVTDKGLEVNYIDVDRQDKWGKDFPEFYHRLPYNNETRRNVGFLMALQDGCERLISIDDDNWPTDDDFIGSHQITGTNYDGKLLSESSGFHNICEYLQFEPSRPIYPRGFPFKLRETVNSPTYQLPAQKQVVIGATGGLWLKDPDIDAITWLNGTVQGTSYHGPDLFVLDQKTWSPLNTQNTSVVRDLIPAYLCIPMGWDVPGGKIQRYGDIWGGYFLQALIQNTPYHLAYGLPLAEHRRNPHDYVNDLRCEYWGTILTDWLLELLRSDFQATGNDMCDRVMQLSEFLDREAIAKLPQWCSPEMAEFLRWTAGNLKAWSEVCRLF